MIDFVLFRIKEIEEPVDVEEEEEEEEEDEEIVIEGVEDVEEDEEEDEEEVKVEVKGNCAFCFQNFIITNNRFCKTENCPFSILCENCDFSGFCPQCVKFQVVIPPDLRHDLDFFNSLTLAKINAIAESRQRKEIFEKLGFF